MTYVQSTRYQQDKGAHELAYVSKQVASQTIYFIISMKNMPQGLTEKQQMAYSTKAWKSAVAAEAAYHAKFAPTPVLK